MPERVEIVEVGPRDGLQNEARQIATADKIALINRLSACGLRRIEATAFVSARWVPQMADASEVMAGITRAPGVVYGALVPNLTGYASARAAGVDEIAVFAAASEGFSRANTNAGIAESVARFAAIGERARADGVALRGYVSCVTDCPYDGPTPPESVGRVALALHALGCHEISLGETLGRATPDKVDAMLQVVCAMVPVAALAGHFHDTAGGACANVDIALAHGLRVFDASVGGLGGCPYAPGAAGNVATERLHDHLGARGFDTGLDRAHLMEAAAFAQSLRRAA